MLKSLIDQISAEATRPVVVAECVTLIDQQVKAMSGFKAMALKTAYGAIKTIKRGFVKGVVEALLDDWLAKLEPYYAAWRESGSGSFSEYVTARSEDVAEDLLEVTDARAETTKHKTAKKYYFKHRDKAKQHVVDAVPDLSRLIERNLDSEADSDADSDAAAS